MIPKATWMSLNFETRLHVKHSHLKLFVKKKGEGNKTKKDVRDFDATRGATKLDKGDKSRR
jgi:hypothetical protein